MLEPTQKTIEFYLNPKYKLISGNAQALWHFFIDFMKNGSYCLFYSLEKMHEITGHAKNTLIRSINELESIQTISTQKSHRLNTIYTVIESIKSDKKGNFILSSESLPKNNDLGSDSLPKNSSLSSVSLPIKVANRYPLSSETLLQLYSSNSGPLNSALSHEFGNPKELTISETEKEIDEEEEIKNQQLTYQRISVKLFEAENPNSFKNNLLGIASDGRNKNLAKIGKYYQQKPELVKDTIALKFQTTKVPTYIIGYVAEDLDAYFLKNKQSENRENRKERWIKERKRLITQDVKNWNQKTPEQRVEGRLNLWKVSQILDGIQVTEEQINEKRTELIEFLPKTNNDKKIYVEKQYPEYPPDDFI